MRRIFTQTVARDERSFHSLFIQHAPCEGPRGYVTAAGICASSFSILSFIRNSANSAATRIAFLIAFAFDEPWVMKHTPLTPNKGAPPYSVWSSRFLKSAKALRDSKY